MDAFLKISNGQLLDRSQFFSVHADRDLFLPAVDRRHIDFQKIRSFPLSFCNSMNNGEVREKGLEPPTRQAGPDPKSGASTNSATLAKPAAFKLQKFIKKTKEKRMLSHAPSAGYHVGRLKPLLPLLYIKLHTLPLLQGLVAISYNGLKMDKEVLSVLTRNEPVPLRVVEPLDGTLFHGAGTFPGCDTGRN